MAFGIHFGTANSVVARLQRGELEVLRIDNPPTDWALLGCDRVMPTVVGVADVDELLFGWEAKQRPGSLHAVKRLLRDEKYVEIEGVTLEVEEVAAMIFAHLRRQVAHAGRMDQAVVTIPANSRGLARLRTRTAAGMAPLRVQALLNEPTAAAMAYAFNSPGEETLLVANWGLGTLDVTVLEHVAGVFREKASKGIQRLGGLDFDAALAEAITAEVGGADGWTEAERHFFRIDVEKAKIILSSEESTLVPLPDGWAFEVTREMFADAVRPLVERVQEPIELCLADIGAQPSDIDALLLVGETCRMPVIRDFVSDLLETAPADIDPITAIAEGAAVASGVLSGELEDVEFSVSTEHALGRTVLSPDGSELVFEQLIPRNHPLPAEATVTYHGVEDYQKQFWFDVIEGDPELPVEHPDNVSLAEWVIDIPCPAPVEESGIEVTYRYDRDGILHVSAKMASDGTTVLDEGVDFMTGTLDRSRLLEVASRAQEAVATGFWERGGRDNSGRGRSILSPEVRTLIEDVRSQIIPFVDEEEADKMHVLMERIEAATDAVDALLRIAERYPYLLDIEAWAAEGRGFDEYDQSPKPVVLSPEIRLLVNDATIKIIPFIDDWEAKEMRALVERVEAGKTGAADALRRLVKEYPYLL